MERGLEEEMSSLRIVGKQVFPALISDTKAAKAQKKSSLEGNLLPVTLFLIIMIIFKNLTSKTSGIWDLRMNPFL